MGSEDTPPARVLKPWPKAPGEQRGDGRGLRGRSLVGGRGLTWDQARLQHPQGPPQPREAPQEGRHLLTWVRVGGALARRAAGRHVVLKAVHVREEQVLIGQQRRVAPGAGVHVQQPQPQPVHRPLQPPQPLRRGAPPQLLRAAAQEAPRGACSCPAQQVDVRGRGRLQLGRAGAREAARVREVHEHAGTHDCLAGGSRDLYTQVTHFRCLTPPPGTSGKYYY